MVETCEQCGREIDDLFEPEYYEGHGPFCDGDCSKEYMDEWTEKEDDE